MDLFLIVLGFILCIVGIVGSLLPILPGPPISWVGLLLLYFVDGMEMNYWLLGATLFIAILIFILDYIIPAAGTKKYGGSKAGAIGTTIGLVVGIFIPIPLAFLIGPFVGAFVGEFVFNKSSSKIAFRAAVGSFMGFLASTFMKFFVALIYLGVFIFLCFKHQAILF